MITVYTDSSYVCGTLECIAVTNPIRDVQQNRSLSPRTRRRLCPTGERRCLIWLFQTFLLS
jgi:hypothetical protein